MTRNALAIIALLGVLGCGRGNLDRDVWRQLTAPFQLPDEENARDKFYSAIRDRCAIPSDAVFISYDYRTAPFVFGPDEVCVSVGVVVQATARSATNKTAYSVREDWYSTQHNWKPILLRRTVILLDEQTEEARHTMDKAVVDAIFERENTQIGQPER